MQFQNLIVIIIKIDLDDKVILYEFYEEYSEDTNLLN